MTEVRAKLSELASVTTSHRSNLRVPPLEGLFKFGPKLATNYKGVKEHHAPQVGETSVATCSDDASGLATEVVTTFVSIQTETDPGYGTTSVDCDTAESARTTLTFSRKPIPQQYLDRLFDIRALFTEPLLDTMSTKQRPTKGASMKLKYADHDDSIYLVIQCDKRDTKRMRKFFAQSHVKESIGDDINIHVTTGLRQLSTQELKVYKRAPGGVTSGTMVKISGTNRSTTATIGGAISVVKNGQKILYGMTAGHILHRLIDESKHQPSCPRSDPRSDSDTSYDSDESTDDDRSEVLPGLPWQPILDVGIITEHSLQSPSSSANHDWALVALHPGHSISNFIPPPDEARFMTMTFNLPISISIQSSVKVITPTSRGNKRGTLTPGTSCLLVAPGREFVETHDVVLDDGCCFQPGDSGSWVIEEATGKVYGHVVSIDMFGEANVMPFSHTLRDIQTHLQADYVGLPEDARQRAVQSETNTEPLKKSHGADDQKTTLDPLYWSDCPDWSEHESIQDTKSYTTWDSERPPSPRPTDICHLTANQIPPSGSGTGDQAGSFGVKEKESGLRKLPGGLLAVPSTPRSFVHNGQNLTQGTIMIEPTRESQRFYNAQRRLMDMQRPGIYVEENIDSAASAGHPLASLVNLEGGESITSSSLDPITVAVQRKPHRGRRNGPLDMETRTKTAFKRKFKLTCAFHRAKRVSCNCHDFSKLEEGYRKFCAAKEKRQRGSIRNWIKPIGPERDIETFGAGGISMVQGPNSVTSSDCNAPGFQQWSSHGEVDLPIDYAQENTADLSLIQDAEKTNDSVCGTDTRDAKISSFSSWSPHATTTIAMPLPRM